MPVLNLDWNLPSADWMRSGTWDIPAHDEASLNAFLIARGMTGRQFKRLPVYKANQHKIHWLGRAHLDW